MKKYEYKGDYEHGRYYENGNIAIYNNFPYAVDIPTEELNHTRYVMGEYPENSRYWKRVVPMQDEIDIKFKYKEVEMIVSCIKMALKEGLYDFKNDDIESSDEDVLMILIKLGVDKKKAEDMIKYC